MCQVDTARARLIAAGAGALAAFAALTVLVRAGLPLGGDLALARAVQAVSWQALPWSPARPLFAVVDYVDGPRQVALAAAVIAAIFIIHRRTAWVALACSVSAGAYTLVELAVQRPRPPADLVQVTRHASGFSYPSGHAVFYFWALALLVVAIAHRSRRAAAAAAVLAALLYASVLVGRIALGEHWPSDVLAGALLGGGWTLAALGLVGQRDRHRLALGEPVEHPLDRELAPDP